MSYESENILADVNRCVLCGSCKADCPTYEIYLSEAYSPRGRMRIIQGLVQKELNPSSRSIYEKLYSCLLCGACKNRCPAEVDVPGAVVYAKANFPLEKKPVLSTLIKLGATKPGLLYTVARISYPLLRRILLKHRIVYEGFEFLSPHGHGVFKPSVPEFKGRIALFLGCSVRFLLPFIATSFIRICIRAGYEVVILPSEVCCGAPLFVNGMLQQAEALAIKNIETFQSLDVDRLLCCCPTCVVTIRQTYKELFKTEIDIMDSVEFLHGLHLPVSDIQEKVFLHYPCHSRYGLHQSEEPLKILQNTGLKVTDTSHKCCGLAGTFFLRFKDTSEQLLHRALTGLKTQHSDLVVTSCPGCVFQLSKALSPERVLHIVELIDELISPSELHEDPNTAE